MKKVKILSRWIIEGKQMQGQEYETNDDGLKWLDSIKVQYQLLTPAFSGVNSVEGNGAEGSGAEKDNSNKPVNQTAK